MKLRAPGFAQVHKAAGNSTSPLGIVDVPPAEVRWAIPWQVGPCRLCDPAQQHPVQKTLWLPATLVTKPLITDHLPANSQTRLFEHAGNADCCLSHVTVEGLFPAGSVDSRAALGQQRCTIS